MAVLTEPGPAAVAPSLPPAGDTPRRGSALEWVAIHAFAVAAGLFFVLPFVFVALTAVMSDQQSLTRDLWPHPVVWHNLVQVWRTPGFGTWWRNTIVYAVTGTALTMVSSIPVAYALACFRFRGRNLAMMVVIATMMLPPQVAIVPMYLVWAKQLHLSGTLWPLIVPLAFGDAYSIFLLRQFLLTIPREYLEAAKVDGCSDLRALLRIVLPMARPGVAAVALFQFFYCWNDYFGPQIYTSENPGAWTLSYGLQSFKSAHHTNWNLTMAATLLVMAPVIVLFFLAQRAFIEGVTLTGVKGDPPVRIAVVGGGSTYTPELVDGLGRLRDVLPVDELVLVDPDAARLELVGGLGRRILARLGHPATLRTTTDLEPALDGVDAVLLQLRVGGQAARQQDETWPLECGCVGQETTGAGGLAKALRTVPVVLDIAERVRRRAPDAWIVDFTNPVGIVTRALLQEGHRAVGLCNAAIGFQRRFAGLLGVEPDRVELDHVGLNHLTWVRRVEVDGADRLPALLGEHADELAEAIGVPAALMIRLGVVPSYYLRYFYAHDAVVRELVAAGREGSRAARVSAIEAELLTMYADPTLDRKPALLEERGGAYYSEAAVLLAADLLGRPGGAPSRHVVNLRNDGTLPFLPEDAVVEVPATVDHAGVRAVEVTPLAPLYAGLVSAVTAYEHLALDAALRGGRDRVFDALLAHPLVGQVDLADALTDRLLAHNREHLPWA